MVGAWWATQRIRALLRLRVTGNQIEATGFILSPRACAADAGGSAPGSPVLANARSDVEDKLAAKLHKGARLSLTKRFAAADVEKYVTLTGDHNPIHVDESAAQQHGLGGPIVPGMLMVSLFPAIIGTHFPGAVYASQTLKFRSPARVGERAGGVARERGSRHILWTHHVLMWGVKNEVAHPTYAHCFFFNGVYAGGRLADGSGHRGETQWQQTNICHAL